MINGSGEIVHYKMLKYSNYILLKIRHLEYVCVYFLLICLGEQAPVFIRSGVLRVKQGGI